MPHSKVHQAAQEGNLIQLKQLIESDSRLANAPRKLLNGRDVYPLEEALCNRHYDCAILLLEYGANPSIQYSYCNDKLTPLHIVAEKHILPKVLLLLYFGANTTCKDTVGITPLGKLGLLPPQHGYKITPEAFKKYIEDFNQLRTLENQYTDAAKNNKQEEQKNLAIEIGNIFMRMGNEVIRFPQTEEYYLAIAQFFYKKAIPYYSLVADFYYKHLNEKQFDKNKYLEVGTLLADLHHRIHDFDMRDHYDKQLLAVDTNYQRSNDDMEWREKTTIKKLPSSHSTPFWLKPIELLHKLTNGETYKNWLRLHP